MKIGCQLKHVRERLAKGLVDKGILRTDKKNFLLFEMPTHPLVDASVKYDLVRNICEMLCSRNSVQAVLQATTTSSPQVSLPHFRIKTISMICAAYAGSVLENALIPLDPEMQEHAYQKVDELLHDFSCWPMNGAAKSFVEALGSGSPGVGGRDAGEVIAAVLAVYGKMDSVF